MSAVAFDERLESLLLAHPSEEQFHELCELYWQASPPQRNRLRSLVLPTMESWRIPERVNPASDPHERERLIIRVRHLLLWTAITGVLADYRDTVGYIDWVCTCSRPYDIDIDARLLEAASVAPSGVADILRSRVGCAG